ncbi:MAG: hypothetical protein PF961_09650 [Planctomycetota bacterium]|jgi:hypothetical protein|nr:hypothetical protein [Planctomycetota bacterium]
MSNQSPRGGLEIEVCPEWDKRNKARLALPWKFTFDDLANGILQALGWDCDHLYQFCLIRGGSTFRQQMLRSLKILGPMVDAWDGEEFYTDAPLAEFKTKLPPKAVLYFHFDFGDDHYFRIIVQKHLDEINEDEFLKPFPKAIQQYPQWGDEEADDDGD